MKRRFLAFLLLPVLLTGCASPMETPPVSEVSAPQTMPTEPAPTQEPAPQTEPTDGGNEMKLWINEREIPVVWEENDTVEALTQQAAQGDIVVAMSMYSDNEQVGPLGQSFPRADVQTTTQNGDIVLYSGDQIVVFYGSNSWAYTRLGRMTLDAQAVTQLLSKGNVTLRLTT